MEKQEALRIITGLGFKVRSAIWNPEINFISMPGSCRLIGEESSMKGCRGWKILAIRGQADNGSLEKYWYLNWDIARSDMLKGFGSDITEHRYEVIVADTMLPKFIDWIQSQLGEDDLRGVEEVGTIL